MKNTYVIALIAVTTATLLSGCATNDIKQSKTTLPKDTLKTAPNNNITKWGTKSKKLINKERSRQ